MDPTQFDAFVQSCGRSGTRRAVVRRLIGAVAALGLGAAGAAEATSRHPHHRHPSAADHRAKPGRLRPQPAAATHPATHADQGNPGGRAPAKHKKHKNPKCLTADGLKACNGYCIAQEEPCCPVGQRPCDGQCTAADGCCATEFARCVAPFSNDWDAAVAGCASACADRPSDACHACLQNVLTTYADPLTRCIALDCLGPTTGERAATRTAPAARPATCDAAALRRCHLDALITNSASGGYEAALALLDTPLAALGAILLNAGKYKADLKACDEQYGCVEGECDAQHGVCCAGVAKCEFYDPNAGRCKGCAKGTYCGLGTGRCEPICKECFDYLVNGRQMPCGTITNNCGQTLTCNGCPSNQQCVDRVCVDKCPRGARRVKTQAGETCCVPQTCQQLGIECGPAPDGCGQTLQCGGCPNGQTCQAGRCQGGGGGGGCTPKTCQQLGIACGAANDGCGATLQCGSCDASQCLTCAGGACVSTCTTGQSCVSGRCQGSSCTPQTCAAFGCTNGPVPDGCGGTIDCSCGSGGVCIKSHCCAADQVCGDDLSGLACCDTPAQCCTTNSVSSPSGLTHYCCPTDTICVGKENPSLASCQSVAAG